MPDIATQNRWARSADAFVETIGVNTNLMKQESWGYKGNAYSNFGAVQDALDYLGIKNVRDYFAFDYTMDEIQRLGDQGIRFNALLASGPRVDHDAEIRHIRENADIIRYVEGPNEVDYHDIFFNGLTGYSATRSMRSWAKWALDSDWRTDEIPLLNATLGNPGANLGKLGGMGG
jgi:hypothetical protein